MVTEHPSARHLREENILLKKSEARARRLYDEIKDEVLKLRKDGRKTPEELKEQIEEKQNEIDRLEGDLDSKDEELKSLQENLEALHKDISSSIRQVEILVGGGHAAKYHEIDPEDLLDTLRSWQNDLSQIISR